MHRNTYLLVSILAVVAALVIGVNIGRQGTIQQTVQPPPTPTPTTVASSITKSYNNSFCKVAFDYPASYTFLENASGSAAFIQPHSNGAGFTNPKGDDGIILTCQKDIPRPAATKETVEDVRIGSVAAKLYNNQSLIFRHPGTKLDVFLAGTGEAFLKLISSVSLLP